METVALLAEGVDRNNIDSVYDRTCSVALLAEGVDRNRGDAREECGKLASPSSRRAWIEIFSSLYSVWSASVALLAEGVDRNTVFIASRNSITLSPSLRRAWIEIGMA